MSRTPRPRKRKGCARWRRSSPADGTAIAYERRGAGPPLVLVHGTGRDRSHWAPSLPGFARDARVYALDRRGRGGSGDADRYAIAREVEDILAVIDAIGEPVHLLGHSYGAIVALEAALRSERLRSLTSTNRRSGSVPRPGARPRRPARGAPGDRRSRGGARHVPAEGPRYPPEVIVARGPRPRWPADLALAHTLPRAADGAALRLRSRAGCGRSGVTLLLLGEQEPAVLPDGDRGAGGGVAPPHAGRVPGQHHNAMETAPILFTQTVSRFLRDHRQQSALW